MIKLTKKRNKKNSLLEIYRNASIKKLGKIQPLSTPIVFVNE